MQTIQHRPAAHKPPRVVHEAGFPVRAAIVGNERGFAVYVDGTTYRGLSSTCLEAVEKLHALLLRRELRRVRDARQAALRG